MLGLQFNSLFDLAKAFDTEEKCIEYLEELRWINGVVVSPYDPNSKVYKCVGNKYKCKNTGLYFNVKTDTMFDCTKIKLQKWFMAIWLITMHKKGISSHQLARDIEVTQKTAWFMLQRIRNCYGFENDHELDNKVEVDETFIGGAEKNKHANKRTEGTQGRSCKTKTPVFGMVEREGKLVAKVVKSTKAKYLVPEIVKTIKESASVFSDEWVAYKNIDKLYDHFVIKHKEHEYVNGDIYTNTIEGFWSLFKRGILGIYHFVSKKHLQKYVDEFVFRYNTRTFASETARFDYLLNNVSNRYLPYKTLVA
jgi:transposase-like protein